MDDFLIDPCVRATYSSYPLWPAMVYKNPMTDIETVLVSGVGTTFSPELTRERGRRVIVSAYAREDNLQVAPREDDLEIEYEI